MIKNICTICKKEYWIKPYQVNKSKYCSSKCYGISKKGKIFYSQKGISPSKETRRKLSKILKNRIVWNKGITYSCPKLIGHIPWNKGKKYPQYSGANHPRWKSDKKSDGRGYKTIYIPLHPFSNKGYILEHRFIVEKQIGRYLHSFEIVHHINEIKDDNRPENLMLFKNASEHMKFHCNS